MNDAAFVISIIFPIQFHARTIETCEFLEVGKWVIKTICTRAPPHSSQKKTGFCEVISFTIRVIRSLHFLSSLPFMSLLFSGRRQQKVVHRRACCRFSLSPHPFGSQIRVSDIMLRCWIIYIRAGPSVRRRCRNLINGAEARAATFV